MRNSGLILPMILLLTSRVFGEDVPVHLLHHVGPNCHLIYSDSKLQAMKGKPYEKEYTDLGVKFVGVSEEAEGNVQLFLWFHPPTDLHYAGFELPIQAKGMILDAMPLYVWKKKGEGLVPIYCSTAPNGSDAYMTADKDEHNKKIALDWKSRKIKRINLGIVFYAKPAPKPDESKTSKP